MCLFGSYQRRSTTLAIVGSSLLGFGVEVWDVGDGDEGKGSMLQVQRPGGPSMSLHSACGFGHLLDLYPITAV